MIVALHLLSYTSGIAYWTYFVMPHMYTAILIYFIGDLCRFQEYFMMEYDGGLLHGGWKTGISWGKPMTIHPEATS